MTRLAIAFALGFAFAVTTAVAQDAATSAAAPEASAAETAGPGVEGGGGILYGKGHAFAVSAPEGWMFDNRSGVHQGLHAAAYRKGETYSKSESLMYARGNDPDPDHPRTLEDFIADDVASFRANSPALQTFELEGFALADGTPIRTVGYRGDQWGNVEAVAYIEHKGAIYVLVLTARSQARFDADLPSFREFVRSVQPMDRGEDDAPDA